MYLSDIYYNHIVKAKITAHPTYQDIININYEMIKEAEQYVKELTSIKDNWKNVLKYDVKQINPYDTMIKMAFNLPDPSKKYEGMTYEMDGGKLTDNECRYLIHIELVNSLFNIVEQTIKRYFNEDIKLIEWTKSKDERKGIETQYTSDMEPPKGDPGRPDAKPFKDYIITENKDILLQILHEFLDKENATTRAKYIIAIKDEWLIDLPGHQSVHNEFNKRKRNTTYEDRIKLHFGHMTKDKKYIIKPFSEKELEDVRKLIRAKMEQLKAEKTMNK